MSFQNFKDFLKKLFSGNSISQKKSFSTLSIIMDDFNWLSCLVEWLKSPGFDKSFKWDEWIWFGFVPAIAPFIIYIIWKKNE